MTDQDRETTVADFIRIRLAARTKVAVDQIQPSSRLIALGLQSIDAVLLCGEVEEAFEIELDPTTIFESDTVGGFTATVLERMGRG